jgi:hypothetical protein
MLLNAFTTGRSIAFATHSLSVRPPSIASMRPSRAG